MSKFVVIVFPGEAQAYEGTRVLTELHAEGSVTLYGMAVIAKDAAGHSSIKAEADAGPLGTAVGALVGGLLGVIGGPVGVLAGAAGGTLMGSVVDIVNYGVGEDFVVQVSEELGAGKTAIVAELVENWTTPLDARMEALGGTVLRTWRADFEDEQVAKEVTALRADLEQLRAEYAEAREEARAAIKAKLDQAESDLEAAEERLEARLEALKAEVNAKVAALEKQLVEAHADAKEKIRRNIAAIRADYEARSAKLKQAWALAKEALAA
ncbi:DUF1269 domain-containing protein [Faunimonas sp. B44]|uniref:DUF1269 domain-containing protein n=1 Tax=Faunimonas sp. B44 TaxID=3461493 RepID=UPI004043C91F